MKRQARCTLQRVGSLRTRCSRSRAQLLKSKLMFFFCPGSVPKGISPLWSHWHPDIKRSLQQKMPLQRASLNGKGIEGGTHRILLHKCTANKRHSTTNLKWCSVGTNFFWQTPVWIFVKQVDYRKMLLANRTDHVMKCLNLSISQLLIASKLSSIHLAAHFDK